MLTMIPAGCRQASRASLRTIWPNAAGGAFGRASMVMLVMTALLPGADAFR